MTVSNASLEAKQLIKILGITEPYVDVENIAKQLNINLILEELDDDVSGFLVIKDKEPTIIVNKLHGKNRRRFTIAHEIGHFKLHAASGKKIGRASCRERV